MLPPFMTDGSNTVEPVSRVREIIGDRMRVSWKNA